MMLESNPLIYQPKENKRWYEKIILTIPAISYSIWCLAATAYTALIYTHVHNILKNVTIHIET